MAEEVPADAVMKLTSGETVTYFDDIQDAIAAVNALKTGSHELVALKDVETLGNEYTRFRIYAEVTLDLNGKHLVLNNHGYAAHNGIAIAVEEDAHLILVDSVGGGEIEVNGVGFYLTEQEGPSALTVKGGTINASKGAVSAFNTSTVNIEGGTFNGHLASNGSAGLHDVIFNISGGKFNDMMYFPGVNNKINIFGGEFTPIGKKAVIEIRSGVLNISGGTFINHKNTDDNKTLSPVTNGSGNLEGVIVASKPNENYQGHTVVNITGGQFNNDLGDILVLGNIEDGNTVSLVANVASGLIADNKINIYDKNPGIASTYNWLVNYADVNELFEEFDNLKEVDYSAASYTVLEQAIANLDDLLVKVYTDETILKAELNQKVAVANTAFANLVDLTDAKDAYALYTRLNLDPYTKDTKDAFTTALNALDAQIKNANVTADQLVTAVNNVKATNAALRKIDAPVVIEVDEEVLKEIGITAPTVGGLDTAITFTPQEIAAGAKAEVALKPRTLDTVAPAEKVLVDAYFANLPTKPANVLLLDIALNKVVGGNSVPIANANGSIEIAFGLPAAFKNVAFHIIRIHDGVVEVLPHVVVDGVVTFETDKFSTYGIVEGAAVVPTEPDKTPPTGLANDYALYMMTLILASAVILFTRKRKYN